MLRHIVIDYEDRELGDLIRSCAKRVEGCAQICVGLLNLDGEVGRQSSRAVFAALSRVVGYPGSAGHDDRRAVAVRRRVKIGRAPVWTPVNTAKLVCRPPPE